ncbi:hypothetical protein [Paenibacillus silvae]|uniref:hypothetical protein n=1 Tax=Paenibacillus silvae TaxID=1325358 RepID=UPI002004DE30|nr:hypothetical protein [Paenibacillus silvae]MCK6075252.1 hypothetical protein [Paenibacillus silvae]MCK6149639.1 hypothetical protein [Paenibacillus silvae]MCK6267937.1 hypothetical protein [Paenibacillus silvae]
MKILSYEWICWSSRSWWNLILIFAIIGFVLYFVFLFAIKRSGLREEISALWKEIRMLEQKVENNGKNFNDHI